MAKASLACWLALVAMGCAHAGRANPATPGAQSAREAIAQDARARFALGEGKLRRGLFAEAQADFEALRTKYPYSPEGVLSELREADLLFLQARYIEAAEAYKSFLRFHPGHAEAGYARAEAAESLLAQVPRDWWFLPPVAEKDQQILRQTIEAYDDLMASGPTPRQAERAQRARHRCQVQLAQHELYVARFYVRRQAYAGAAARAQSLLAEPQPPEVASQALWLAAQAARGAKDLPRAEGHLRQLTSDYPNSREARLAQQQLRKSAQKAEKDTAK
jgi:outer membrane protein assembly factor BamD